MKVTARQVDPALQTSPLDYEEFPENITVCGNSHLKEHLTPTFETVRDALDDGYLACYVDDPKEAGFRNVTQAINYELPPIGRKPYSTHDIHDICKIVTEYQSCPRSAETDLLLKLLGIVTGMKWAVKTLRGSCQSDWNYAYYRVDEWDDKALEAFNAIYWNEGSEWIVSIDEEEEFYTYCTTFNERAELAENFECDPGDVTLITWEAQLHD